MDHGDHLDLLRAGIPRPGGTWADFGSGTGAFTLALAELVGHAGEIYSIDKDRGALRTQAQAFQSRLPAFPTEKLHWIAADFTRPLDLPPLDGAIAANSIHFMRKKEPFLELVHTWLKPGGRFILVEYNVDRGNLWVPYPVSFQAWESLARMSGFLGTRLLHTRPSRFLKEIYSAVSFTGETMEGFSKDQSQSHQGQPVLQAGEPLDRAKAAMIMVHGRGASAEDILALSSEFQQGGFSYLAPQAVGNTWYPQSFLAPIPENEPWLSSALSLLGEVNQRLAGAGFPPERTIWLGFSQGACLALEFAARNARRYGGLVGLSGGLIGPPGTPRDYQGSLAGTPVFLGCSDVDPHIPKSRVIETAEVLKRLGSEVTTRLYPGMGHTVNREEIRLVREMMAALVAGNSS